MTKITLIELPRKAKDSYTKLPLEDQHRTSVSQTSEIIEELEEMAETFHESCFSHLEIKCI